MRLDWDRPGVVRATLKVQELAALVAGARLAAAALAAQSPEQADELERVLEGFDRSVAHLQRVGGAVDPGGAGAATASSVETEGARSTTRRLAVALDPDQGKEELTYE